MEYDSIQLELEDFNIILPSTVIEKLEVDKVEQFIESKYNPSDLYNIYLVINRKLGEEVWKEAKVKGFDGMVTGWKIAVIDSDGTPEYQSLADCIASNSIYRIELFKGTESVQSYDPVWTNTQFTNGNQRTGVTDEKIIIRIKEV